ncbi:GNAT family N-acetyltransferase [Azospirillum soli]|uniref:GNAT family N-acetyltransferase n=1 Tax=Azospirillum soli TaxID=1304799 RepID=UPI001AE7A3AE|nr:RimJ/RimL family protein N-acetyltransferase [Azospirillum soli]
MILRAPLVSPRLVLRALTDNDVGPAYLGWLTDPDVVRHLEVRFSDCSGEAVRRFIASTNASNDSLLCGITLRNDGKHIGNIKLGPVNPWHRRAELGLVIGDRTEWGKGYATEAIALITEHAFTVLGLEKVTAGCYSGNEGSRRAFVTAGYSEVGRIPRHWLCDGQWQDNVILQKLLPAAVP